MAKKPLVRVTDPSEGIVHFQAVGVQDGATLCYAFNLREGVETEEPVTCPDCIGIVSAIQAAAKEKFPK